MKAFFTPGPSHLFPGVEDFIADALRDHVMSISHRGAEFSRIFNHAADNLRTLMDIPKDYHIFFVGSATEAMERVVQNMAESRTHHFVNGAFSERFYQTALELGKQATETRVPWGKGFTRKQMSTVPKDVELVAFTHNETSTGVALNMEGVYACKRAHPDVLIAVDAVSSAPMVPIDFAFVDCVFFSVQKAFGLPAGLGVMIVSPAALAKSNMLAEKALAGSYHSFKSLAKSASKAQTPSTPNVLGMYLLGRVTEAMSARGIAQLRQENRDRAALLYDLIEQHPNLAPFVVDEEHRSPTVIVAQVADSPSLLAALAKQGLIVGDGYGEEYKPVHIRIANFPATSTQHIEALVAALKQHE